MANVSFTFKPILPKRDPFKNIERGLVEATVLLGSFLYAAQNELQNYPPQRSGRYRRTGELGRRWKVEVPKRRGLDIVGRIGNNKPYAVWVEGPTKGSGKKQRALFKRLGWPSVTDVGKRQWRVYRPRIRQAMRKRR